MTTPEHSAGQRSNPCQATGPLQILGTKAGLLLNSDGIIEDANAEAASLLNRTPEELRGAPFGLILRRNVPVALDVTDASGRQIEARFMDDEPVGGKAIVLLNARTSEEARAVEPGPAGLADVKPILDKYSVVVKQMCRWPSGVPGLRSIVANCVTCLIAIAMPEAGTLRVRSVRTSGGMEVLFDLWAEESGRSGQSMTFFGGLVEQVTAAGCQVQLEFTVDGPCLRLLVPVELDRGIGLVPRPS